MVLENFTTFTETDEDGDITISSATLITVDTMRRDAVSYVRKSYGANHFGDFTHLFTINVPTIQQYAWAASWSLTNQDGRTLDQMDADNSGIVFRIYGQNADDPRLTIKDYTNDNSDEAVFDACPAGADRWITINRTGTTLTAYIYTDATRTTLKDTLVITCGVQTYQYLQAVANRGLAGTWSESISFTVANLDLQEAKPQSTSIINIMQALGIL